MEEPITPSAPPATRTRAWLGWIAYAAVAAFAATGAYSLGYRHGEPRPEAEPVAAAAPVTPEAPAPEAAQPRVPEKTTHAGVVRAGDTVSSLLRSVLSPQEIHDLAKAAEPVFPLSRICAGQPYEVVTADGAFESLAYEIDREEKLVACRVDSTFRVSRAPIPYRVEPEIVQGTIRSSLFEAVSEIGESPELAFALAEIFAWDIDFLLDIRQGDSFQVLVERRFRGDDPAGYGRLLAAQFTNQGDTFNAVWFQDGDQPGAYYDLGGNSLRKAFLKAPLTFTRISSGFTKKRFHPITKTWKAHPAIDYAAPTGTPIKAVGDGMVAEKGHTSGNGNYVKIRHNGTYETLYLHMSRFAKGLKQGKRVSQGDVIGYVGSSGLATGPHLCFRMYQNGSPVNPMRIQSTSANPVSTANMAAFEVLAARLTAQFDAEHLEQASLGDRKDTAVR